MQNINPSYYSVHTFLFTLSRVEKHLIIPVGAQLGLCRSQGGLSWGHSVPIQKPLRIQEPREAEVYGIEGDLSAFLGQIRCVKRGKWALNF